MDIKNSFFAAFWQKRVKKKDQNVSRAKRFFGSIDFLISQGPIMIS